MINKCVGRTFKRLQAKREREGNNLRIEGYKRRKTRHSGERAKARTKKTASNLEIPWDGKMMELFPPRLRGGALGGAQEEVCAVEPHAVRVVVRGDQQELQGEVERAQGAVSIGTVKDNVKAVGAVTKAALPV